MQLTMTEKLLTYGLSLTDLPDEEEEAIFSALETEEEQMRMIMFLKENPRATNQEILNELGRIIELTQAQKSQKSSEN